jgi:hypothetical protein
MRLKLMLAAVVLSIVLFAALSPAAEKTLTVKGYVIDSTCTFTKNLGKPISKECATNCANAGSMLVILADDGTIYWPIADSMPATGQNSKLLPFAAQKVTVSGKVYERGGSKAIVIEHIEPQAASK